MNAQSAVASLYIDERWRKLLDLVLEICDFVCGHGFDALRDLFGEAFVP